MQPTTNPLSVLADRTRAGDPVAAESLNRQLTARMARVVRQVLRTGGGGSDLDRRILRECRQVGGGRDDAALAEQVARRLCGAALAGLEGSAARPVRPFETVRGL